MIDRFKAIWVYDFEFSQPAGELPEIRCLVAHELNSGKRVRLWADGMGDCPIGTGRECLSVCFSAPAEMSCFKVLGWPMPERILDLYVEFRWLTNGRYDGKPSMLGALKYFGLSAMSATAKDSMRDLAIRGGRYTETEKRDLLNYCENDVTATTSLLRKMQDRIDFPRAVHRGRYQAAVASMEATGVPVDVGTLDVFRSNWTKLKGRLIRDVGGKYGVFVPSAPDLNAGTPFGAVVTSVADQHGIDPQFLAKCATDNWRRERELKLPFVAAVKEARKRTGLTVKRVHRWENEGYDHSRVLGLDVTARELAADLPELGLGRGYVTGEVYDGRDHAAELWEILRQEDPKPRSRNDRTLVEETAVELIEAGATDWPIEAPRKFSNRRFAEWLERESIPWPTTPSGLPCTDKDTFREQAKAHPQVALLSELITSLGQLRLESLAVGLDGRNRVPLFPFGARSGRNTPSNSRFVFGPSRWIRGLIAPGPGRAVVYVDYSQQELLIAAMLSGDEMLRLAYEAGDPYLAFAKQAGAVPPDATKQSHPAQRAMFKTCMLGVQFGMGAGALASRINGTVGDATRLLDHHKRTYRKYWRWREAVISRANLDGFVDTALGWRRYVATNDSPQSIANHPVQGTGADILRYACILLTEAGIAVCAPVHDAVVIEADESRIEDVVAETRRLMTVAGQAIIHADLGTDAVVVRHPDRYRDESGGEMWDRVVEILHEWGAWEWAGGF